MGPLGLWGSEVHPGDAGGGRGLGSVERALGVPSGRGVQVPVFTLLSLQLTLQPGPSGPM